MEENTQPDGTRSTLLPGWRWRLIIVIVAYCVFYTVSFSAKTGPQQLRMVLVIVCLATAAFVTAYRPHTAIRTARVASYRIAVLGHFGLLVIPTAYLTGVYDLPAEDRYAAMLTPTYIVPCALFLAAYALAWPLAESFYRRNHPDTATIPATPEDLEEWQTSPSERRSMVRVFLLVSLVFAPTFVASWLWPGHSTLIMLANMALVGCAFSFWAGYRWREIDTRMRRFWLVMVCVGPPAGFVGYVEHGGVPGALVFAAEIAAVMIVPGIAGWFLARHRGTVTEG